VPRHHPAARPSSLLTRRVGAFTACTAPPDESSALAAGSAGRTDRVSRTHRSDGDGVAARATVADQSGVTAGTAVLAGAAVAEQEASVAAVACRAGAVIRGVDAIADKYATWADQIEWAEGVEHSEGVGRSADTGAEQRPITAAHQLGSLGDLA